MSNQLQHRLSHFEVEPRAGMWDTISEALEDQSTLAAEKLRQFEAAPAPRLWQNIESELNSEEEALSQAVPHHRRYDALLRYGSAAAILVLVAVAISFLVNTGRNSSEVAHREQATQPASPTIQPKDRVVTLRESEDPREQQSRTRTKKRSEQASQSTASTADHSTAVKASQRAAASRYLTVASETGTPVRLSKKVYHVFDCAEHSTALKRFQCRENIETLQKMASSLASPSGDFASLIDMIKTLEENR